MMCETVVFSIKAPGNWTHADLTPSLFARKPLCIQRLWPGYNSVLALLFRPYMLYTARSGQIKMIDVPFLELRNRATQGAFPSGTQTVPCVVTRAFTKTHAGLAAAGSGRKAGLLGASKGTLGSNRSKAARPCLLPAGGTGPPLLEDTVPIGK